jgi:hypothetical protein
LLLLAHDLVELRGTHALGLQLLKRFSSVYSLMLTDVSNEQNPVLRPQLLHERLHLFRASQAGLIDHVQVTAGGISGGLSGCTASKETLQGLCVNPGVTELVRSTVRRRETLDGKTFGLGPCADGS